MSHSLSRSPQTLGHDTEKELQAPAADDSASTEEAYMVAKETNHSGSRKTNKRWTGASSDLALPVTLQFISSASREVNTRKFFLFYVCHLAEVLEMTKYRERKQLGVRGWECYPFGSCNDSAPRATSPGTITCVIPSSRCSTSCRGRWAGSRWLLWVHPNIFKLTVGSPATKTCLQS